MPQSACAAQLEQLAQLAQLSHLRQLLSFLTCAFEHPVCQLASSAVQLAAELPVHGVLTAHVAADPAVKLALQLAVQLTDQLAAVTLVGGLLTEAWGVAGAAQKAGGGRERAGEGFVSR